MNKIIITHMNDSWLMVEEFGQSFICKQLKYENYNIISKKDIKLIATLKKLQQVRYLKNMLLNDIYRDNNPELLKQP